MIVSRATTATTLEHVLRALVEHAPASVRATPRLVSAVAGLVGAETSYASINNWNLGNVSAGSWTGDVWEVEDAPTGQPSQFRAYDTLDAGAADLWRILGADRYAAALMLGRGGFWRAFGLELGRSGYVAGLTATQADAYAENARTWARRAVAVFEERGRFGVNVGAALLLAGAGLGYLGARSGLAISRDTGAAWANVGAGAALLAVNNIAGQARTRGPTPPDWDGTGLVNVSNEGVHAWRPVDEFMMMLGAQWYEISGSLSLSRTDYAATFPITIERSSGLETLLGAAKFRFRWDGQSGVVRWPRWTWRDYIRVSRVQAST